MTTIYLAGPQSGCAIEAARRWDWDAKPLSVLVSFAYMRAYAPAAPYYAKAKSFMLDSGAFTAYTTGATIDIDELIAETNKPIWNEAVGLDVIGSWEGSKKNMEYMLPRCPKAMPVFHIGDPWDLLDYYCANWEKVGLSCRFGEPLKTSIRFYEQCFARTWPHKFHSFGWVQDDVLIAMPFHSADASTWVMKSTAYREYPFRGRGRWRSIQVPVDYKLDVVSDGCMMQADRFWHLEQQLVDRWSKELSKL